MSDDTYRVKTRDEVLVDYVRESPVDRQQSHTRRWLTIGCVVVLIAVAVWLGWG